MDERYQGHAKALSKAGLAPKIYPTLKEIWKKADALKLIKDAKRKKEKWRKRKKYVFLYRVLQDMAGKDIQHHKKAS